MEAVLRRFPPPSSAPPGLTLPHPALLRKHASQQGPNKGAAACRYSHLLSDGLPPRRQQQRQRKMLLWPDGSDGGGRRAGSGVVTAAKKKKTSGKSEPDGFLPGKNELFFPEAVLLKKKTVQEDGRVLPEFADAEEEKLFEFLNLRQENAVGIERMRHYEVVYLIHEDHLHEVDNVVSKVQDFIREKRGKIWRLNNWGLRRLAYKVKKAKNANYILMNFELEAKFINDFKSMLDKEERVIRHLVMKRDEAITEDCPPPPDFHTLRGIKVDGNDDDDDDDDDDGEWFGGEQGWDNKVESEMDDYKDDDYDDDDFGGNVIFVDDEEVDDNDVPHKNAEILKAKKWVKSAS